MIGKGPQTPISVTQITEQQQIEVAQSQLALPRIYVAKSQGQATPSVKNINRLVFNNAAPINVTNFLKAQEGQEIQILGDGQTTLVHDVTKVILLSGANTLLSSTKVYVLTIFNGIWIEH